jgi:putative SOS response-associated peptidase YedK
MCGRYALYGPISRHRKNKPVDDLPEWYPSLVDHLNARPMRFNVAPTDVMPIIGVNKEGEPTVRELRSGLVPYWAKDIKIGYKAINARAESVDEKSMFREAFKRRRCLVPASGYFEWKPEGSAKQPYFIHDPDRDLLMFAGLWESWRETKESDPLYTFTIVTGPPGLVSGDIHDRAPLILSETDWERWLSGEPADAADVLNAAQEPRLAYYPVPKAVGSPKNDVPQLVEPIAVEPSGGAE